MKIIVILFMLGSAIGQTDGPHKYLLLYEHDSGICQPYVSYPEGGCPHMRAQGREFVDTVEQAISWLNDHTDQDSDFAGGRVIVLPRLSPSDYVELFKIEKVELERMPSSQTYDAYETKRELVKKPLKEWVAKPEVKP